MPIDILCVCFNEKRSREIQGIATTHLEGEPHADCEPGETHSTTGTRDTFTWDSKFTTMEYQPQKREHPQVQREGPETHALHHQVVQVGYYLTELTSRLKGYSMYFRVAGARVYFEIQCLGCVGGYV